MLKILFFLFFFDLNTTQMFLYVCVFSNSNSYFFIFDLNKSLFFSFETPLMNIHIYIHDFTKKKIQIPKILGKYMYVSS